jgi:aromatic-L-amino-acid decarboxylase
VGDFGTLEDSLNRDEGSVPVSHPGLSLSTERAGALHHAFERVLGAWNEFDHAREHETEISPQLHKLLESPLPDTGMSVTGVIDQAADILDASLAQSRPRYFAFIGSSGLEVGALADLLAATYDTNLAVDARAATALEWQTVTWLASFLGFPAQTGNFTSGGTLSNITALASARERALPGSRSTGLAGARPTLYCSREAHYSITRAAEVLGIGADFVRAIEIDGERRMRADRTREALARDLAEGYTPVAIIATAGTTLTGAIDPLDELARVAREFNVWLHVDGAYGLPAAAVDARRALFTGLEEADSVTVDCHKWMFVPKACSAVLVKDLGSLARTFSHDEAYMPHEGEHYNAVDITLEYSRPLRALKLWMAFAVHGASAVREAVGINCDQAQMLYDWARVRPHFETLTSRPQLSIVPFRVVPTGCPDPDAHTSELCARLQLDGRVYVSPATIDGEVWLRPCFTNFRTTASDVRALLDVADELGRECSTLHG